MTKRNTDLNNSDHASLEDLDLLHRYARARHFGEKQSINNFAATHSDVTTDRLTSAVQRIEKKLGIYLLCKRPERYKEVPVDLIWPEDWTNFLEQLQQGDIDASEGGKQPPGKAAKEWSITNKSEMTLAGEIWGEVASLYAGYSAIARSAVVRDAEKGRPAKEDLGAVLAWLRTERRKLHLLVERMLLEDPSMVSLGRNVDEEVFAPHPSDTQDMLRLELTPESFGYDIVDAPIKSDLPMLSYRERERSKLGLSSNNWSSKLKRRRT